MAMARPVGHGLKLGVLWTAIGLGLLEAVWEKTGNRRRVGRESRPHHRTV